MAKAKTAAPASLPGRTKARVLLLVFFLLLLYIILPRLDTFSASIAALENARPALVAAATILVFITFTLAAGVYHSLALRLRGVQYRHTLLVQVAGAFTNRLLPAGLGGLTLNVQYLRKHGHTLPQSLAVAGLNNLLGAVGHLLLLGLIFTGTPDALAGQLEFPAFSSTWLIIGVAILVIGMNLFVFRRVRRYLQQVAHDLLSYLAIYRKRPEKILAALFCSLALTSCYVLIFYLCVDSLGIALQLWHVFIVFTVGVIAGTVTPTPGGLIGAEAGLVAGLAAYGVDPSAALAVALLYRFLTYWLPLLPGFIVFLAIRRRYL